MKREEIADLMAFVVVAEERSFTRAAARLSMGTNGYCWLTGLFFSPKCSNVSVTINRSSGN